MIRAVVVGGPYDGRVIALGGAEPPPVVYLVKPAPPLRLDGCWGADPSALSPLFERTVCPLLRDAAEQPTRTADGAYRYAWPEGA